MKLSLKISLLALLLAYSSLVAAQQQPPIDTTSDGANDADEDEEEEMGYQVRVLKFGESDEENLNDFGVHTNNFAVNITDELVGDKNNHPVFLYVVNS